MAYTSEFDQLVQGLPADWAYFECHLTVNDPLQLADARVALARANARPLKDRADHDFEITVASTHGRGAHPGVVRSALRVLDDLGIDGRLWCGLVTDLVRPAPAHRYGP